MELPTDAELSQRALDILEWLAKVAGSLTIVAAFVAKVLVPYKRWRQESLGRSIRAVLKPELDLLQGVIAQDAECAGRMERILRRQEELFDEHDMLYQVALDNRSRLDEYNDLLSALGLESDRRRGEERRHLTEHLMHELGERRRERRRRTDQ